MNRHMLEIPSFLAPASTANEEYEPRLQPLRLQPTGRLTQRCSSIKRNEFWKNTTKHKISKNKMRLPNFFFILQSPIRTMQTCRVSRVFDNFMRCCNGFKHEANHSVACPPSSFLHWWQFCKTHKYKCAWTPSLLPPPHGLFHCVDCATTAPPVSYRNQYTGSPMQSHNLHHSDGNKKWIRACFSYWLLTSDLLALDSLKMCG